MAMIKQDERAGSRCRASCALAACPPAHLQGRQVLERRDDVQLSSSQGRVLGQTMCCLEDRTVLHAQSKLINAMQGARSAGEARGRCRHCAA